RCRCGRPAARCGCCQARRRSSGPFAAQIERRFYPKGLAWPAAAFSLVGSAHRTMANPPHPAPREPGALWLLGLSILCAAAAATLLLAGHAVGGGVAALAASIGCFAAAGAGGGRATFALGAAGPLVDAAVLAPIAWTFRTDDTTVAALALVTLGAALV